MGFLDTILSDNLIYIYMYTYIYIYIRKGRCGGPIFTVL